MSTPKAFAALAATILVVGAYLALTFLLGIPQYWPGFLFLFLWSTIEGMKIERLAHAAIGSAGGLVLAALPVWLAPTLGASGASGVMLGAILLCVFSLLKGWAGIVCNLGMMLFLTIATIPQIAGHTSPADMFAGLASGVLFFGGLALIATRVMAARPAPVPAE